MTRHMIAIEIQEDYRPGESTSILEIAIEERSKINSGEWQAYGVGLARESDSGVIASDYGTFVWGFVTDAGHEGLYFGTDRVRNEFLREAAEAAVTEYTDKSEES